MNNFLGQRAWQSSRVLLSLFLIALSLGFFFLYQNDFSLKKFYTSAFYSPSSSTGTVAGSTNFYGNTISLIKLFGQKSWGDTNYDLVSPEQIHHAAGVAVDQSSGSARVYVVDSGNNRVLGFESVNVPRPQAQIALGQISPREGAACNRDNNIGMFGNASASTLCFTPYPVAPNIEEYSMRINIDIDSQGNVYVPDLWNNRILKYNQPYSSDVSGGKGDAIADFVWGQKSFSDTQPNMGQGVDHRDAMGLFIGGQKGYADVSSRGVSTDAQGNIWVADTYNFRVLRFPPNSPQADMVIGQPDFQSPPSAPDADQICQISPANRPLNRTCTPTLAKINPDNGKLYVLDESNPNFSARILVFTPPFVNGMAASSIIIPQQPGSFTNWNEPYVFQSNGFSFNTYKTGEYAAGTIWVNEHMTLRTLLIDDEGKIIKVVGAPNANLRGCDYDLYNRCGTDIAQNFNLCWPGGAPALANIGPNSSTQLLLADEHFHRIARVQLPYNTTTIGDATCLPEPTEGIAPGIIPNSINPNGLGGTALGIAVANDQLIVKDKLRYVIWNNYKDPGAEVTPPVILGQSTGDVRTPNDMGSRSEHAIDDMNRLWFVNAQGQLVVYQLPLQASSLPLSASTQLFWDDDPATPVEVNTGESAVSFDSINKYIWLSDNRNNRLLRIKNYTEAGSGKLLVDAVLGQPDKQSVQCNVNQQENWIASGAPAANTLCNPQLTKFDRMGNFYVVENTFECHGNNRIIMYEAQDMKNISTMFPMVPAKKVFIRKSLIEQALCESERTDEPYSPIGLAFDSSNHMVVGSDGYYPDDTHRAWKQLWYYCNPLAQDVGGYAQGQKPDAYINLPMGATGELAFDDQDNLIIQDHTWSRVWMINLTKDPQWLVSVNNSSCVQGTAGPTPTPTITPAAAATPTPTKSPTPTRKPSLQPTPTIKLGPNLTINGSFEKTDKSGLPTNWSINQRNTSTDTIVSTEKMDGKKSFYMVCQPNKSKSLYQSIAGNWQSGAILRLSLFSKSSTMSGPEATAGLKILLNNNSQSEYFTLLKRTTTQWTQSELLVQLNKPAKKITVSVDCNKKNGAIYVDNVTLSHVLNRSQLPLP